MHASTHSPTDRPIHHPFTHPSIHPSILPFIHPPSCVTRSSTHPSISASIHASLLKLRHHSRRNRKQRRNEQPHSFSSTLRRKPLECTMYNRQCTSHECICPARFDNKSTTIGMASTHFVHALRVGRCAGLLPIFDFPLSVGTASGSSTDLKQPKLRR